MSEHDIEINKTLAVLVFEVKGINKRLDEQNGSIKAHFKSDEEWMDAHSLLHAERKGYADGRASVRKGDLAMLLGAVTIATGLVNAAMRFL